MLRRALTLLALTLPVACGGLDTADSEHALSGAWVARSVVVEHDCVGLGDLAPVGQGIFHFVPVEGGLMLVREDIAEEATLQAAELSVYRRALTADEESCGLGGAAEWRFTEVSDASFVAEHVRDVEPSTACEVTYSSCRTRYRVLGVRPR